MPKIPSRIRVFVIASMLSFGAVAQYDVTGDGQQDALGDGLIIMRHLFGFSYPVLCEGSITNNTRRNCDRIKGRVISGTDVKGCIVRAGVISCDWRK